MAVKNDALMLGLQQAKAHVGAHSPEADHSDLHVSYAPGVGLRLFGVLAFDFGYIGPKSARPLLVSGARYRQRRRRFARAHSLLQDQLPRHSAHPRQAPRENGAAG